MPRSSEAKEARLPLVERMKSDGFSIDEIAAQLKVSPSSIDADMRELRKRGHIKAARAQLPHSQEGRDSLFTAAIRTTDTIRWLITEGRTLLQDVREYMGLNHAPCEACGCKGRYNNAQDFMAASKIMDSLTNSLTLLAKVLGEITDSPIVNINQIDQDATLFLSAIARGDQRVFEQIQIVDRQLELLGKEEPQFLPHVNSMRVRLSDIGKQPIGRYVYQELTGASARRQERLDSFPAIREQALLPSPDAIEGEFEEVE
jgi:DNA-binding Lrp family transcriptional regulator